MKNITNNSTPPRNDFEAPIVHKINNLYKLLYLLGSKIPKRDKLGLHQKIENLCLEILTLSINASLANKNKKLPILEILRIKTETLKNLVRLSSEIKIIKESSYLRIEAELQEISKMTSGWIKYLEKQNPLGHGSEGIL